MTLMDQFKTYVNEWKPVENIDGTWVIEKGMGTIERKFPKDKTLAGAQSLADKLNAEETA